MTSLISQIITPNDIENLTTEFLRLVAVSKDGAKVNDMFCEDGTLIGPDSSIKHKGTEIQTYFTNFSNIPNLRVLKKNYKITHVQGDVFLNTAFVLWMWDGLETPLLARMSFVFKRKNIFHLNSSVLPEFE